MNELTGSFFGGLPPPSLVAAARVLLQMSQQELAQAAQIPTSSLARYEKGRAGLHSKTVTSLLDAFEQLGVRWIVRSGKIMMGVYLVESDAPLKDR